MSSSDSNSSHSSQTFVRRNTVVSRISDNLNSTQSFVGRDSVVSRSSDNLPSDLVVPGCCGNLGSTLNQLNSELVNARHRFRPDFHADQQPLLAPFRWLYKNKTLNLSILGDEQLYLSLQANIKEIEDDNRFFGIFLNSIHRWTNAADIILSLESFPSLIEDVAGKISRDLVICTENKYLLTNPLKLLDVLYDSREKFEFLKMRILEVPDCLAGCCFELKSPLNDFRVWENFVKSVQQNIRLLIQEEVDDECPNLGEQLDAFNQKLKFLQSFLGQASQSSLNSHRVAEDFLNHVANVVVRTAYQSCYCWFVKKDTIFARSKITALLDLQHEIALTNPDFLEFILKFMIAVSKSSHHQMMGQGNLVRSFLNYLLKWGNDLDKELTFLLTFVIRNPEESRKDVYSVVTEIKGLLLGVGFLYEPVFIGGRIDPSLCSELLMKICLLKAEVSLVELVNNGTSSNRQQIGELFEVLKDLTRCSENLPVEKEENGQMALALFEEVTMDVPLLYQSFQVKKITSYRLKISLLLLRIRIVLFRAESFLMELLKTSASFTIVGKDLIETLLVDLKLFSTVVRKHQMEITEALESIFSHIEAVARRITVLSYVFIANEMTEQMINNLMLSFGDSLDKVKLVKKKLQDNWPKFPASHFPKTNELGFMDFLLRNLGELLNYNPNSIAHVKDHIKEIQSHLEFLRPFLIHILKSDNHSLELKEFGENVIHFAYKVEYVIDMIEIDANWQQFLWLYDLLDEIRDIRLQASKIQENPCDARVHNVVHISSHRISLASSPDIAEMVVSLTDEEEVIMDRLTRGSSQRDIVSIVGMPGIGKTTLAKKVYNDPNIEYYFHRRAWCSVSQVYGKRELMLGIIKDIHGLPDEIHQMTDADLELKLCQQLRKIRYLIVMDDVWDIEALNDLERSFPDDGTGSRILITSRFRKVAMEAKPDSDPHMLRPFSDDESWKLLVMKSFPKVGSCPEELVQIGKEIAHQCEGLPLAVVAIAGILERTENKQDCWEKIAESLSSRINADSENRCREILELSYRHLPFHLKACFLYFGSFAEDKEIPVSKLIRLWIAEGLIQNNEAKSLEDVAEDYLMDLIDRSLVMISKRGSNGRVKTCCMHDLLRDLCLSKAQEENFLQLITRYNEPYASFDLSDYGSDFYDFYPINPVTYECHRLCICLKRKHFVYSKPSGPCTRSLIFLACSDTYPRRPYNVSFISHHFKLLRVLDLECINMGISFPPEIELLVQLRYLAVSGDLDSIPSSISNLRKLETLIVKGLSGKVVLPDTIWRMRSLRHLHVNNYAVFDLQDEEIDSSFQLDNLVSFSMPSLSQEKNAEKIIRRLPNLRKLRCVFLESWDSSVNCNQFPRLESLTELDSLKVIYFGRDLNPGGFNFPLNLTKLTLSNFRLPWYQICAIGKLPKLEVLKLLFGAFEGEMWHMRESEFCKLKFLKLDTLNFAKWDVSSDHLPELQHLVLRNCKKLDEIPIELAEIPTLHMIEVQGCKRSVEVSVRKIKEETEVGVISLVMVLLRNAKREIQRQNGGVASDSDKFDPSTNTRSRRPGILGKSVSYKHRYSSLLSEGDCNLISSQDTMELDLPGAHNYESQEDNADADTETQERNVAGSITKTENRVNEILDELLSRSSKDFDGDGALSLLQERLKIKPIDLGKLSIPDFHDVGRADFLALREKQPKVRKTLSNISNLAKRSSGEAHVKQKKVGESLISPIASPTPLKSPFASISLLKKRSAQCGSLRDPFSPLNVDSHFMLISS